MGLDYVFRQVSDDYNFCVGFFRGLGGHIHLDIFIVLHGLGRGRATSGVGHGRGCGGKRQGALNKLQSPVNIC